MYVPSFKYRKTMTFKKMNNKGLFTEHEVCPVKCLAAVFIADRASGANRTFPSTDQTREVNKLFFLRLIDLLHNRNFNINEMVNTLSQR